MELHDVEESMAIRKILAHDIRMKKNPQTKDDTFWIVDFYGVMRTQSPIAPPHGNFVNGVANPEIVYILLRFQMLFIHRP